MAKTMTKEPTQAQRSPREQLNLEISQVEAALDRTSAEAVKVDNQYYALLSQGRMEEAGRMKATLHELEDGREMLTERLKVLHSRFPTIEKAEAQERLTRSIADYKSGIAALNQAHETAAIQWFSALEQLERVKTRQLELGQLSAKIHEAAAEAGIPGPELDPIPTQPHANAIVNSNSRLRAAIN